MAVTQTQPVKIAYGTWRIGWTSDVSAPTFYVYFHGRLEIVTMDEEFVMVTGDDSEPPAIEVYDDPAVIADQLKESGRMVLQWYAVPGNASVVYRVEHLQGSSWITKLHVVENGRGVYQYPTAWLADMVEAYFRVIPIDSVGREADPIEFTAMVVRNPDPPEIALTYAGGDLTVSSA